MRVLSLPRKSLFGKRPKPTPRAERKPEEPEESSKHEEKTQVSAPSSLGNGTRFGKTRKIEKIERVEKTVSEGAQTKITQSPKVRATKQRPNLANRRIENIEEVVATTTPNAVTSKPSESNENIVSKYVRSSKIVRNVAKNSGLTEKTRKPQVSQKISERSTNLPKDMDSDIGTTLKPTPRYTRRRLEPKAFQKFDPVPKTSGEPEPSIPVKREFRPRTATYRRHSEAPAPPGPSAPISIAITPKSPKFHSNFKSDSTLPQSSPKTVNVQISESSNGSNDTAQSDNNPGLGVVGSSNGESGNGGSNVFSPTRSVFLINRNTSLLEQLRSTVAPLLSSLGLKTPVFAGAFRNTTSSGVSENHFLCMHLEYSAFDRPSEINL